jgi:hypothetical protein
LILLLLDKIAVSGAKNLIEILHAWESIEYKKVQTRIQEVINELEKVEEKPDEKNKHEKIRSLTPDAFIHKRAGGQAPFFVLYI